MKDLTSSDCKLNYVKRFVSNVLGASINSLNPDYCDKIFKRLTLTHEVNTQIRDLHGNFDWSFDDAHLRGQIYSPHIDIPISLLRQKLQVSHPEITFEPIWPNGKRFALCLTHDVDEVTQKKSWSKIYRRFIQTIRSKSGSIAIGKESLFSLARIYRKLSHRGLDPLWHYDDWLKLEDKYGYKSTFFFFPSHVGHPHYYDCTYSVKDSIVYDGKKMSVKQMMQEMDRNGWEVGLHGSYHSAVQPELIQAQRRQIASALQKNITSTRQHCLRYDPVVTPTLHSQAGFLADSTQGYNRSVGFRAGTSFPYWAWNHQENCSLPLLEIPLNIMDCTLFNPLIFAYDEQTAIRHCLHIMDNVEQVGGCLTLNWHPNYLNNKQWWNVYATLLEEARHRNAWGCSVAQLYEWWTEREKRITANPLLQHQDINIGQVEIPQFFRV